MIRRYSAFVCTFMLVCTLLFSSAYAGEGLLWPVDGEVVTGFSSGSHRGIDIAAAVGSPIAAAEEGVVYWVGRTPRGEPCVSIDHPNGLSTSYLPVEADIQEGQEVIRGQIIGVLTADGDVSSDEPHLHLGLFETTTRANKRYLDPQGYLVARGTGQLPGHGRVPALENVGSPAGAETIPARGVEAERTPAPQTVPAVAGQPQQVAMGGAPAGATNQRKVEIPATTIRLSSTSVNTDINAQGAAQATSSGAVAPATDMPAGVMPTETVDVALSGSAGQSAVGRVMPPGIVIAAARESAPIMISQAAAAHSIQGSPGRTGAGQAAALRAAQPESTAGPNPFAAKSTSVQAASVQAAVKPAQRVGSASAPKVAGRFLFGWRFLPEFILACALSAIIMRSVRFVKRMKSRPLPEWPEVGTVSAMVA